MRQLPLGMHCCRCQPEREAPGRVPRCQSSGKCRVMLECKEGDYTCMKIHPHPRCPACLITLVEILGQPTSGSPGISVIQCKRARSAVSLHVVWLAHGTGLCHGRCRHLLYVLRPFWCISRCCLHPCIYSSRPLSPTCEDYAQQHAVTHSSCPARNTSGTQYRKW